MQASDKTDVLRRVRDQAESFRTDYGILMLHQSPRFLGQLRRELLFCKAHPSIWLWGLSLYAVTDSLLAGLFPLNLEQANRIALSGYSAAFLLFRFWRLRLKRGP